MYLLDANACIRILRNTSQPLLDRFRRHDPSEIKLCSVVKAELFYGAQRSMQKEANRLLLQRFFTTFECLPFDDESADHYGRIRFELERAGAIIGPNDLLIASIARAHGLVLVTHNTDEFSRVSGLRIDDWELAV
ncbi:MAG TPA: type II toxin-antitoxin system VapC family toxin [Thermoanaerobaculia bacterium]|nr:type II toxin-antitoxin system VapC family toxin [Thermoanaerobaculia bacterium]